MNGPYFALLLGMRIFEMLLIVLLVTNVGCSKNQFMSQKSTESESGLADPNPMDSFYQDINLFEPEAYSMKCEIYSKSTSDVSRARIMISPNCGAQTVGYRLLEDGQIVQNSFNNNLYLGGYANMFLPIANYESSSNRQVTVQMFDGRSWLPTQNKQSVVSQINSSACSVLLTEQSEGVRFEIQGNCAEKGISIRSKTHRGYVLDALTPVLEVKVTLPLTVVFKDGRNGYEKAVNINPKFNQSQLSF